MWNAGKVLDTSLTIVLVASLLGSGMLIQRLMGKPSSDPGSAGHVRARIRNWTDMLSPGHRIGSPSAKVTILEFGDYECPACGAFQNRALHGLRARFPSDVALVYRHWPLPYHKHAYMLAHASECAARQGSFEAFHQTVFANQDSLEELSPSELARRSGITDLTLFGTCTADTTVAPIVEADMLAIASLGGFATPTVYINGVYFSEATDSVALDAYVSRLLPPPTRKSSGSKP